MHHDFIDRYSRMDSAIHRLPVALKASASALMILLAVMTPVGFLIPHIILGGVLIVAALMSRLPGRFLVRRVLLFEPFIIAVASLALLQPGGLPRFYSMMLKSTISLVTVVLLSNTTPFADLLNLLRRLHAPGVLTTILALMYRYLFVLLDEVGRMNRARRSRTIRSGSLRWGILANLLGQLFVRSTERAERIFAAMSARGWQ